MLAAAGRGENGRESGQGKTATTAATADLQKEQKSYQLGPLGHIKQIQI